MSDPQARHPSAKLNRPSRATPGVFTGLVVVVLASIAAAVWLGSASAILAGAGLCLAAAVFAVVWLVRSDLKATQASIEERLEVLAAIRIAPPGAAPLRPADLDDDELRMLLADCQGELAARREKGPDPARQAVREGFAKQQARLLAARVAAEHRIADGKVPAPVIKRT
jgi:hypothetical protein